MLISAGQPLLYPFSPLGQGSQAVSSPLCGCHGALLYAFYSALLQLPGAKGPYAFW